MADQTVIPPARQQFGPMSIKNLVPRLPERGKIKIGIKGKTITSSLGNQFQPPQKLDHFIVTTLDRGQDGNFVLDEDFHKKHGKTPTEIPVSMLYDDPALNFQTRYAAYTGRTLWCSGDGESATRISEEPGKAVAKTPLTVQCPCFRQGPTYEGPGRCKMNGSLSVLIEGAGGLGGVWKFRTTSYNTIVGILSSMAFIRSVTGGPLAGIPFKLVLQKKRATKPGTQDPVDIFIVNLTYSGTASDLMATGHNIALERTRTHLSIEHIEEEARRLLSLPMPENVILPGDDAEDVIDEFYVDDAAIVPVAELVEPQLQQPDDLMLADDPNRAWPFVRWNGEPATMPTRKKAVEAVEKILLARAKHGLEALDAAWTNNGVLIVELQEAGYGDEAEGLETVYQELRGDLVAEPEATIPVNEPPTGNDDENLSRTAVEAEETVDERVEVGEATAEDWAEENDLPEDAEPAEYAEPLPTATVEPQQDLIPPEPSRTRQSRERHDAFWDARSLAIAPPQGKGKGVLDWKLWPVLIQQRINQAWTKETIDTLYLHNEQNFLSYATARGERDCAELKAEFDRARLGLPFASDL